MFEQCSCGRCPSATAVVIEFPLLYMLPRCIYLGYAKHLFFYIVPRATQVPSHVNCQGQFQFLLMAHIFGHGHGIDWLSWVPF